MRCAVAMLHTATIVCCTRSGHTSFRGPRERPASTVLSLTSILAAARRLGVVWGVHSAQIKGVSDVKEMTDLACAVAREEGIAVSGQIFVIIAGMPSGRASTTNLMRIAVAYPAGQQARPQ